MEVSTALCPPQPRPSSSRCWALARLPFRVGRLRVPLLPLGRRAVTESFCCIVSLRGQTTCLFVRENLGLGLWGQEPAGRVL